MPDTHEAVTIGTKLAAPVSDQVEVQVWSQLSKESLDRVWDNKADTAYDNWRELYDLQAR